MNSLYCLVEFWRNVSNFFSRTVRLIMLMVSLYNHCFGRGYSATQKKRTVEYRYLHWTATYQNKKTELFYLSREVKPWTSSYNLVFKRFYTNFLVRTNFFCTLLYFLNLVGNHMRHKKCLTIKMLETNWYYLCTIDELFEIIT